MKRTAMLLCSVAIVIAMVGVAPVVVASGTVTFTSTADFDGGSKGAPLTQGTWATRTAMPLNTADSAFAVYSGSLYVIGGYGNSSTTDIRDENLRYTAASDSWSSLAAIPTAKWGAAGATWADRIYVFAGINATGVSVSTVHYYNVTANSWTARTAVSGISGGGACAVAYGPDTIFVSSGATLTAYSVSGDSYSSKASMIANQPGTFANCAIVGTFLYVAGGSQQNTVVHRYDIGANSWDDAYDVAPYNELGGLTNIVLSGRIHYGYGFDNANIFDAWMYSYEPIGKTWIRLPQGSSPRDGVASGLISGKVYAVGGRDGAAVGVTTNEEYDTTVAADNNNAIDTATDSAYVAAGSVQMASIGGDTFSTADADADTFKWNKAWVGNTAVGGSDGDSFSISSGSANLVWASQANTENTYLFSNSTYSGSIDARILGTRTSGFLVFGLFDYAHGYYSHPSQDGVMYYWRAATDVVDAFSITGGALTQVGTSTTIGATIYLRIAVSGTTVTWYYSANGASWTQDETVTFTMPANVYVAIGTEHAPAAAASFAVSEFFLAGGSIGTGGFRRSASWTSATQTYSTETVSRITMTYSGVSAANYIADVSLRNAAGDTLWHYGSAITSGTQTVMDIPFDKSLEQNWAIRVDLAGGGSGSAAIEQIDVNTEELPGPPPPGRVLKMDFVCSYNPFIRGWSCADRTDYTGWVPEVFDTLRYAYDGREVAATPNRGATVTFEAGESILSDGGDHVLVVTWNLRNGGTPSATYILHADNRLAQITFAIVGVLLLAVIVAAIMRRRGGAIAFEQVQNPAYRHAATSVEEFPKGWRSYRQHAPRPDLPTQSERRGDLWIIYQLRPATAAEQARTGRKRIAYVQTVREKM